MNFYLYRHTYSYIYAKYLYKIPKVNTMFRLNGNILEALKIKSRELKHLSPLIFNIPLDMLI